MNPDPRVRRGAHRTSRAASATLLPSLLAILAVTSLITALYVWRGEDSKPPSAAASSGSPSPQVHTTTPPVTTASKTTTPSADPTTESATATSSPVKTHKAKTDPAAQLRASTQIVVLNQTARSGLAATVASRLRAKGWTVSSVGNFRGVVPATTVYYPVGKEAAAAAAAKNLPTPPRVLPRFGNLSDTRLTVIVTSELPELIRMTCPPRPATPAAPGWQQCSTALARRCWAWTSTGPWPPSSPTRTRRAPTPTYPLPLPGSRPGWAASR